MFSKIEKALKRVSLKLITGLICLCFVFLISEASFSQCTGEGCGNSSNTNINYNPIQNNLNNASQSMSNAQIVNENNNVSFVAAGGGNIPTPLPPSAYITNINHNNAWNYVAPNILFDNSKVIGGNTIFSNCRLVNVNAGIRHSVKDIFFGVFDERTYVMSGVNNIFNNGGGCCCGAGCRNKCSSCSTKINISSMLCCGQGITQIPNGIGIFIGSGHVFMENYSTSEAALVALAQMGSKRGANLVGNIYCGFSEAVQSFGLGVGAGGGYSDKIGNNEFVSGSIGASWGTGITKRPVQPFCTGDFFLTTANALTSAASNNIYAPQPRLYRRYLPSEGAQPMSMMRYAPPSQMPVRGLW